MKKVVLLVPVAVAAIVFFSWVYLNYSFFFTPVETQNCGSDIDCIREMEAMKEQCIPSSTIVTGRDGIILMVNITREGDKCVRTETVVGYEELQSSYLLGHNVTCISNLSDSKPRVCPGSLYDYVVPTGGGGISGGGTASQGPPAITCGIDDDDCRATADTYLQNCINSKITNTVLRWQPDGYWTLFFSVSRLPAECRYYVEVLNAVNLPPGTPTTIIGSNMTCDIPLSEFPTENLSASWCTGELFDFLYT